MRQHGPDNVVATVSWRLQGTQMLDATIVVLLKLPKTATDGDAENVLEAAE